LSDQEAYGSLNMGAGFAVFVPPAKVSDTLAAARSAGIKGWDAGSVEAGAKQIVIEPINVEYQSDDLQLRD
jgi:phosphoribosylformylglycinamidine cyclo-ligase